MSPLANTFPLARWQIMWGLAIAIYAGLKLLTWWMRTSFTTPGWKRAAYLLGWPGMNADRFLRPVATDDLLPTPGEWLFAASKLIFGTMLIAIVVPRLESAPPYLVGWIGMIGLALVLHFGLFHALSCVWRRAGCGASPLMNCPVAAGSLSEFWGRRWNLAFRDVTHRFVFRPMVRPLGGIGAMLAGFLVSGLIHDVVISVPAGAGFGLPTCYFLLQGAGVAFERTPLADRLGLGRGIRGWLFCAAVVLLPSTLLFHRPFVGRVILPFLHALGATP